MRTNKLRLKGLASQSSLRSFLPPPPLCSAFFFSCGQCAKNRCLPGYMIRIMQNIFCLVPIRQLRTTQSPFPN
jgi:hypothetical protein